MERKKRSKGRGWESCYVKKIYGTFGVEMRAYGQKLVKFCKHTHVSFSSIDSPNVENVKIIVELRGFAKKFFPKNPSLLWPLMGGSRSHSTFFFWKIIPK